MVKVIDKPEKTGISERTNGTHPTAARALTEPVECEEDAVRVVRALVESSRVREAREKTAEFLQIWPDSKPLKTAESVLAPAIARAVPPRKPQRSRALEYQWIRENARNYPGEWLLVFENRLIASSPSFKEVLERGQSIESGADGVLWFQPGSEWICNRNS
jgi:hypothetical protein